MNNIDQIIEETTDNMVKAGLIQPHYRSDVGNRIKTAIEKAEHGGVSAAETPEEVWQHWWKEHGFGMGICENPCRSAFLSGLYIGKQTISTAAASPATVNDAKQLARTTMTPREKRRFLKRQIAESERLKELAGNHPLMAPLVEQRAEEFRQELQDYRSRFPIAANTDQRKIMDVLDTAIRKNT